MSNRARKLAEIPESEHKDIAVVAYTKGVRYAGGVFDASQHAVSTILREHLAHAKYKALENDVQKGNTVRKPIRTVSAAPSGYVPPLYPEQSHPLYPRVQELKKQGLSSGKIAVELDEDLELINRLFCPFMRQPKTQDQGADEGDEEDLEREPTMKELKSV